jgi:hypothetical protein
MTKRAFLRIGDTGVSILQMANAHCSFMNDHITFGDGLEHSLGLASHIVKQVMGFLPLALEMSSFMVSIFLIHIWAPIQIDKALASSSKGFL